MARVEDISLKTIGNSIKNAAADVLANSDFISRTIGMNNSYEDIMFIVQMLGREPISLLGKNYAFIYDHVRRNYMQGMDIPSKDFEYCNKFTFYKEIPTVRFANPYEDSMNTLGRWKSNLETLSTHLYNTTLHYSESDDGKTNNKSIDNQSGLDGGNPGVANGSIESYQPNLQSCDMIGKTNSNFNHGKYETLVARFHTNAQESKSHDDPTQTANSSTYGQSHGRNLLRKDHFGKVDNGYENPYCRVWTYHHQYNQIMRQIRPLADEGGEGISSENLEAYEKAGGNYSTVGFRTIETNDFSSSSKRLDDYGVLNYKNGTVNIAPTAKISDYFYHKDDEYEKGIINTKKCMFSIENLAWRDKRARNDEFDIYGLSPEQRGPLGGRIMWFPPYDLTFNEDVSVDWNSNKFIGRGENVYTYTNTERRGNLSFTLLIDHPSVLDYWTRKDHNGKELAKGNSGGVDNVDNEENTLLRFFAGCEILAAKPQTYRTHVVKPEIKEEAKEEVKDAPPATDEAKKTTKKQICAILYYPNNYSGKDDRGTVVNPIYYLMNGVGTQKYVNENKNAVDIPTVIDKNLSGGLNKGGYEVYQRQVGGGISQVSQELNPDYYTIKSTYADLKTTERKAQYLTFNWGEEITVNYGSLEYTLAKIIGDKAMSLANAKTRENLTGATHQWYRRRYYYRVDKEYENQEFSDPKSYIDGKSFGLNGDGFRQVRDSSASSIFGIKEDSDDYRLISFTDLFVGLEGEGNNVITPYSSDNVRLVSDIFENKERYSDIVIKFNGHASRQGYKDTNNDLAENRALTVMNWMQSFTAMNGVKMDEIKIINQTNDPKTNTGGVDEKDVKIWRSASIIIEYVEKNIENPAIQKTKVDENGNTIVDSVEVKNKETSLSQNMIENLVKGGYFGDDKKSFNDKMWEIYDNANGTNHLDPTKDNFDNSYLKLDDYEQSTVKRYDNEGEFFKTLTKDAPFLHHLISEKIKYFDPAFHSISPEGFNARLTFLHQCTRQGSTVEQSAFDTTTAYNLAFGRPPVCVLRLGDFFNTKIIISSLNIQYDTPQWDMNPEGIGMMPMFAKVSINFTFLGGSDLAGPIARLQNAVSFNYYANTSVYDNRAEKVKYESNGSGREIAFKGFTYPTLENEKKKGEEF